MDHDEITEEKEREGYYPNKLDEEMKDYTYGDRVDPRWSYTYGWGNWTHGVHGGAYGGWQRAEHDLIAPKYDPNAHFESPYYHLKGPAGGSKSAAQVDNRVPRHNVETDEWDDIIDKATSGNAQSLVQNATSSDLA